MNIATSLRTAHVKSLAIALAAGIVLTGCTANPANSPKPQDAVGFVSPSSGIAGTIAGQRYYTLENPARLARLDGDKLVTLVTTEQTGWASVSPDGKHIAYLVADDDEDAEKGDLMIADANGKGARRLLGEVAVGYSEVAWSPDSTKIATVLASPNTDVTGDRAVVVDVATGKVTPAGFDGLHRRWADDNTLVTGGSCGPTTLEDITGNTIRTTPSLGAQTRAENPQWLCVRTVISANSDGTRVTGFVQSMDEPAGDIVPMEYANSVVDTVTGKLVPLPVKGKVEGALFGSNGDLLVRTRLKDTYTLTQINPAGVVVAQTVEPAALKKAILTSWTN